MISAANTSLQAAGQAAESLEGAIRSFETFRAILGSAPIIGSVVPPTQSTYNPKRSMADSLDDLSGSLEEMPAKFEEMAVNFEKADNNLELVRSNLDTMSSKVSEISTSLGEYQAMVSKSQDSMKNLETMLTRFQSNLGLILTIATIILGLFFLWLLATQVVIFSQGWELFHGTAARMTKPEGEKPLDTQPESNDEAGGSVV